MVLTSTDSGSHSHSPSPTLSLSRADWRGVAWCGLVPNDLCCDSPYLGMVCASSAVSVSKEFLQTELGLFAKLFKLKRAPHASLLHHTVRLQLER